MRAFIFDLDGTLIDSAEDISLCLRKTLEEIGLEDRMPSDVRKLIGGGVRALLERVIGEDFEDSHVKVFRKHYLGNPVVHTRLFPGVLETISELKERGHTLLVVTNKMEDLSREILKILGIDRFFSLIVGGDTYEEKKPSPLPILKALERIGIEPSECLMVGDTDSDILSGRRAGTKTALAGWGYTHSVSEEADIVLERPEDLLQLSMARI